jgi:hypothetical protein
MECTDYAQADAEAVDIDRRQNWIVQQANSLINPPKPLTRSSFANRTSHRNG